MAQSLGAKMPNNGLRGSLDIDSNIAWLISNSSYDNFPLECLVKGQLHNFWRILIPLDELHLNIFFVINYEFDHADFNRRSTWLISTLLIIDLDAHISIANDGLLDQVLPH